MDVVVHMKVLGVGGPALHTHIHTHTHTLCIVPLDQLSR